MEKGCKISIRPLAELLFDDGSRKEEKTKNDGEIDPHENSLPTPLKIESTSNGTPKKNRKKTKAATTSKKKFQYDATTATPIIAKTEVKKQRSKRKDAIPGQLRIDSFYKSATKTYTIPKVSDDCRNTKVCKSTRKPKRRRKALFKDDDSTTTVSDEHYEDIPKRKIKLKTQCVVDLCSDSEEEQRTSSQTKMISLAENARDPLPVPLHTIEEVETVQDSLITGVCPVDSELPVASTSSQARLARSMCLTPKKSEISNCNVWLEKKHITNDTCEYSSLSPAKKNCVQMRTRSCTKMSKICEEVTESSTTKITRKKRLKKILKPLDNVTDIEPAVSPNNNISSIINKESILSPSDTSNNENTGRKKMECSYNMSQNTKPLPTPPESASSVSTETFAHPQSLESCYFIDTITIVDEDQENVRISKSKKVKDRGKLTTATPTPVSRRKTKGPRPCPPYKVVEGTTFAVDAFRYGDIDGVTHYFLTHFHADHYIGLNRNFSHPLYVSPITARLLRVFIPIDEEFLKEISLNTPIVIDSVEVTAIDANHCPGAVMFIFKTREGRCILHTGDFRACAEMESEPIFWNNDIHTIYLDTTYFPKKYAFCPQSDSIDRALHIIEEFHEKNIGTRTLYVCGSYLVGKEKFWSSIAHKLSLKVWTDGNRRKAQNAINDENIIPLLVDDPCDAQMHVIPMMHLSYFTLVEYIDKYSKYFDILFALRPSGWEKDNKPQFRGKVNIVGIEYSEHSSHNDLKRFVQYLKPQKVISTVPVGKDIMRTAKIPDNWYKYNTLTGLQHQFQPAITSYFKTKSVNTSSKKTPSEDGRVTPKSNGYNNEMVISPIEICGCALPIDTEEINEKKNINEAEEDDDWLT